MVCLEIRLWTSWGWRMRGRVVYKGKLCADYNHVEKQCGFSGIHSGASTFQFPPGTRPLPKKKTYLGDENAKSLSLCSSKHFSMLKVNLSQGHLVFGSPKVAKHRFFFMPFSPLLKRNRNNCQFSRLLALLCILKAFAVWDLEENHEK